MEDINVCVKIWDTAGQEQYKSLTKSFYKNCNGVIVVYDVTDRDSFEKVKEWIESIKENAEENIKVILIGNKIDLCKSVHTNEGRKLAKELKISFFETSAKENICVNQAIDTLVEVVIRDFLNQKTRPNSPYNTIDIKKRYIVENDFKCGC